MTADRLAEIKARVADAQTHSVRNDPLFSDLQYVLGEIERLVTDNDAGCMTNTTLNRTVERLQREAEWHAGNTELNQKLLRENDRLRGAVVEAEKLVNGICGNVDRTSNPLVQRLRDWNLPGGNHAALLLREAADEIERLTQAKADWETHCEQLNAECVRLQRELTQMTAQRDGLLELPHPFTRLTKERDRLRTALDAMRKERDHYLHLYNREWRANTEAGRMPAVETAAGRPAAKEGDPCDRCGRQWQSSVVLQGRLHHCCIAQETSGVKTGYMGDINGPGCDPDTG